MLKHVLKTWLDGASDDIDVGVVVYSIETGNEIAKSYCVVVGIGKNGELLISCEIEQRETV
jgi:hypothetical protein